MQLHQLKPTHKGKTRKRVGRGGKRGTYSGKGVKGQNSRSGRILKPAIRELMKRYPKLRGYRQNIKAGSAKYDTAVLNLDILEKHFAAGEKVTPESLLEKKIVRKIKGETPKIKILGTGKLEKALSFENCLVSKQAKEKIEKANGSIK